MGLPKPLTAITALNKKQEKLTEKRSEVKKRAGRAQSTK